MFFATPEDHSHCPLGAHVLGFPLPKQVLQQMRDYYLDRAKQVTGIH